MKMDGQSAVFDLRGQARLHHVRDYTLNVAAWLDVFEDFMLHELGRDRVFRAEGGRRGEGVKQAVPFYKGNGLDGLLTASASQSLGFADNTENQSSLSPGK